MKIGLSIFGIFAAFVFFGGWGLVVAIAAVSAYWTFAPSKSESTSSLFENLRNPQKVVFDSTVFQTFFQVAGHLAKSDGVISKEEIRRTQEVMDRLTLTSEQTKIAVERFNEGKSPSFDIAYCLDQVRSSIGMNRVAGSVLFESLVHICTADGFNREKLELLLLYAKAVGIRETDAAEFLREEIGYANFQSSSRRAYSNESYQQAEVPTKASELHHAYSVLGVAENDTDADVKMAYRRLIQDAHPDRLQAQNLPDFLMEAAVAKTREIQSAWETIREHRGIR